MLWSSDKSELFKKNTHSSGVFFSGILFLLLSSCLAFTAVMPHAGENTEFLFFMQLGIVVSFNLLIYGTRSWTGYSIVITLMTIYTAPSTINLINGKFTFFRIIYVSLMASSAIIGYYVKVKRDLKNNGNVK